MYTEPIRVPACAALNQACAAGAAGDAGAMQGRGCSMHLEPSGRMARCVQTRGVQRRARHASLHRRSA